MSRLLTVAVAAAKRLIFKFKHVQPKSPGSIYMNAVSDFKVGLQPSTVSFGSLRCSDSFATNAKEEFIQKEAYLKSSSKCMFPGA